MIQLKEFTKKYSEYTAVKNLNLIFEDNKITGILGPNGAGKTTILKALTGRHFATEGQVLFSSTPDAAPVDARENPVFLREITGFVEEVSVLPEDLTVFEFLKERQRLFSKDNCQLASIIKECSLEEVINKKIKSLSKGYKERVNFAQALLNNPQILILDEPASGLDPKQIIKMRELVKKLSSSKTIILSTHLMQEVEALCEKVAIIDKGELLIYGTIEEICKATDCPDLEKAFFKLLEQNESGENSAQ